ncbi:MAG: FAD-dependent oxidoreductase [Firmicutes bacterium]|nr:FAD-dependent oxidoreductase [Bacillota bacterium]
MKAKKIVVVGGVAGGASFAARMRRLDEHAHIILLEKGPYISFANCGLPYYIGGVIQNRDALLIQSNERMQNVFNIDVRPLNEVISLDAQKKTVTVKNLQTGETYQENYDYLVLSPGAQPIKPPIPGIEHAPVFTVRNLLDADAIKKYLSTNPVKKAVVVGGGYIGLEMADNLYKLGLELSLVEKAPQLIGTIDYDLAAIVADHIVSKGVKLYLGDGVVEFKQQDKTTKVVLESGKTIDTDLVILAIGVRPDVGFLKESGLEFGPRGGIKVNAKMQTNLPGVYALGDAAEVIDFNTGVETLIPLAGPANKQGRIVADNIAGLEKTYKGTQGTAIAKVFDLTVATTGSNERTLQAQGISYKTAVTLPNSHATYYPDAHMMTVKTHFSPEGKILGAQIIGYEGVDKSIDVLATALRLGLTVYELQELEHAYAPPYNSAKDPVNMVGFVAENMLAGRLETVSWEDIGKRDAFLLDVREKVEVERGMIAGSHHIPLGELRRRLHELPRDREIIVVCRVGQRAYTAACSLRQHGFNARVLAGGYKHYSAVTKALKTINN